jgi:hypothetical protein
MLRKYITEPPKAEHDAPEWQAADVAETAGAPEWLFSPG